jgi:hypothetical protein
MLICFIAVYPPVWALQITSVSRLKRHFTNKFEIFIPCYYVIFENFENFFYSRIIWSLNPFVCVIPYYTIISHAKYQAIQIISFDAKPGLTLVNIPG